MPVTLLNGTPIATNAVGNSLAELLEGPKLDIQRSPQEEDAWCYAACAQMVINHLIPQNFITQCRVATYAKRAVTQTCCSPRPPVCKASGCTERQVGEIFTNFGIDYEGSAAPEAVIGRISPSEIRSEIGDNHPVEVVIDWNSDGVETTSHAVLITGIRDDDSVYITDPMRGFNYNGWQPYSFLKSGFGEGKWVRTWTGLHKK